MKIKQGFVVREVAGKSVAVATGALSREFHGMVTLNGTGRFLFEELKNDTDVEKLTKRLTEEYDVDVDTAQKAVLTFTDALRRAGILEE
ncbi:MAG: PqqD family protein [Ruminococcaceae bacterium]|nr:PqqD family protein [Oscillospiraceae bacterium]